MAAADDDCVSTLLDRWSRGEYEPRTSEIHPDVTVISRPSLRAVRGYHGVRRLMGDLRRSFDAWDLDVDESLQTGRGGRLVVGRIHLRGGKRTGEDLVRNTALLFDLKDGLIVRIELFPERVDDAYAAAGLQRQPPA
jgi:ketosteroid isomerase-like protein